MVVDSKKVQALGEQIRTRQDKYIARTGNHTCAKGR
jgi:hypothetical protein